MVRQVVTGGVEGCVVVQGVVRLVVQGGVRLVHSVLAVLLAAGDSGLHYLQDLLWRSCLGAGVGGRAR